MKHFKQLLFSIILFMSCFVASAQKADSSIISVMNSINYEYFHKHLQYLASDELKGRYIGTKEFDKAASYMANEFKKNGMQPFGDSGTYFQYIEFLKPSITESSVKIQVNRNSKSLNGVFGKNISLLASPKSEKFREEQKLVFAGYGNIIPEEKINDYEDIDVKGKTVIVAVGGPKAIKNYAFEDILVKIQNAESQGAAGIILFYPKHKLFQSLIFRYVHSFLTKSTLYYSDTSIHGSIIDIDLKLCAYSKISFIKDIFSLNGLHYARELRGIERGKRMSKELDMTVSCGYTTEIEHLSSKNVVSIIPGNDSTLRNEYVVIGAHLDHLGIDKKVKGDSIYNGMMDNASGCAALLSIGKAFSQLHKKLKRSVVLISYTAEEEALFGSQYFVNKNEIYDGKIVANLNLDIVANLYEAKGIIPIGYLHSNLSDAIDFATSNLNLEITANKKVDETYLERGDQFSFIRKGIPNLYIIPGSSPVDSKINGLKRTNRWLRKYYHSPFDDLNQSYSEKAFLTGIKVNFLTLYYISNILGDIKWNSRSWVFDRYVRGER